MYNLLHATDQVMDFFRVDMETSLEILTDGRNLIISPVKSEKKKNVSNQHLQK